MNRLDIKERAKNLTSEYLWDFWKGAALVVMISLLGSLLIRFTTEEGSTIRYVLTMVWALIEAPLTLGLTAYVMKIVRGEKFDINDIFKYYKYVLPLVVLNILMSVFVLLWSFLFIIPGIIAALGYSMVIYLFIDGNIEPLDCIRESKRLMKGYRGDYFLFNLSFIGWVIVATCFCMVPFIWVLPYISFAMAIYYEDLRKFKDSSIKAEIGDKVVSAEKATVEEIVVEEVAPVVKKAPAKKKTTASNKKAPAKKKSTSKTATKTAPKKAVAKAKKTTVAKTTSKPATKKSATVKKSSASVKASPAKKTSTNKKSTAKATKK